MANRISANTTTATRMAMNDAAKYGRTRVKDAIRDIYTMKPSRILDSNEERGLKFRPASNNNLVAKITAGHRPANLASFTGNRFNKRGISVQIKKGSNKQIGSVFKLKASKGISGAAAVGNTSVAFARGLYGKPKFQFKRERKPINTLTSVSTATAALNSKAIEKYEPIVSQRYQQELVRQLKRLL